MRGLEISRAYYEEYGLPMLREQFSEVIDRIAVGLVGEGSECLGFDDEISRDHDFDPGFCLWISEEDEKEFGFRLERAYSKLPREFMGLKRGYISPVGGNRRGVMTVEGFYRRHLGDSHTPETVYSWLYTPTGSLLAASNGEVFADVSGAFTAVREKLRRGYPEDIRRKKLAAHVLFMAQSGQYNYARCVARGEVGAAQLATFEFVRHTISAIYLMNNAYEPFYKWAYRGLRELPVLGGIGDALQYLTETDNSTENAKLKASVIEDIASLVADELRAQGLSGANGGDLERHAFSVADGIMDGVLRNMHIMEGV